MNRRFNRSVLTKNISYLLKKQGKKIGEFEAAVGVSPGYLSRMNKDGGTKPGIEFIVDAARELNVDLDMLLCTDMSALSPAEQYLISFLDKLKKDTINDRLDWKKAKEDDPFLSGARDRGDIITGNCCLFQMNRECAIYILNVCGSAENGNGTDITEIWIAMKDSKAECLCTSKGLSEMAEMVSDIYPIVMENIEQPRISREIKSIIDVFMAQGIETDEI